MRAGGRIRADLLRATETLYGPARSRRPSDIHGEDGAVCPFCPGNEHLTAPLLTADPGPDWQSRVVANLYPAVVAPDGRHEVIVETRDHGARWATSSAAELERILRVYRDREADGYAAGFAHVVIFKNSGAPAGASLRHPHAQVIAHATSPQSILARLDRLTPVCVACGVIDGGGAQVVEQTAQFVAYVPHGSRTAFEVRIAPVNHGPRFSGLAGGLSAALAGMLERVMKRLVAVLGEDMPFNIVVQSAPRDPRADAHVHWEIEVIPRVENFGGYELGTGGFLVSRLPEDAAAVLRSAAVVRA